MLSIFLKQKMEAAKYKLLKNKSYFGEISDIPGVWANAKTLEECRRELQGVLEDWLILKLREGEHIQGLSVKIGRREPVRARHA